MDGQLGVWPVGDDGRGRAADRWSRGIRSRGAHPPPRAVREFAWLLASRRSL